MEDKEYWLSISKYPLDSKFSFEVHLTKIGETVGK